MKVVVSFQKSMEHWELDIIADDIQTALVNHDATVHRVLISPKGVILHVELGYRGSLFVEEQLANHFPNFHISIVDDEKEK